MRTVYIICSILSNLNNLSEIHDMLTNNDKPLKILAVSIFYEIIKIEMRPKGGGGSAFCLLAHIALYKKMCNYD